MHFLSKCRFSYTFSTTLFSQYFILWVSHCQGNSRGSKEELWERVSDADSQEWFGVVLDSFDPSLWQWLKLFESELGQGCGRAPSPLLQGGKLKKVCGRKNSQVK